MTTVFINGCGEVRPTQAKHYAIALKPTPILNTPDFRGVFGGSDGATLRLHADGTLHEVETIALPGTVFTVHGITKKSGTEILRVSTREYPYPPLDRYFIDARFVRFTELQPDEPVRPLPPLGQIMDRLRNAVGSAYIWGGHVQEGIPEMLQFYKPSGPISFAHELIWSFRGFDCSGLLYAATNANTPRNTSELVKFGRAVEVEGLAAAQIMKLLRPLDLLVWVGHVMIVLDRDTLIQSDTDDELGWRGVRTMITAETLPRLMNSRLPVNDWTQRPLPVMNRFVVRRWFKAENNPN